ncbi:DUF3999 family protein [Marinomonas fungiae]|uniref:DUF3999 domain-containing protein n=1 Tax=Marinomonas fungiae TaxID=1137284 RepID=A0A0K6ILT4_9GAMM|nr:DUF3999 family protein [Marinomonas fungiae]CUB04272.1 Protein of unknown function (DUF3999) [Marinomonas fungiae]
MNKIAMLAVRWSALWLGLLGSYTLLAQDEVTALYDIESVSDSADVYLEASLPAEIYRYTDSAQLKDIVVLDREGAVLPSRIRMAESKTQSKPEIIALNFFPVLVGTPLTGAILQGKTQLQIDKGSIAISLDPSNVKLAKDEYVYLIDMREHERVLKGLELSWAVDPSSQYLVVEVSGSHDMNRWRSLSSTTLVQLQQGEQSLVRNKIDLPLTSQPYEFLRIAFPDQPDVQPLTIHAEPVQDVTQTPLLSWQVTGTLAQQQDSLITDDGPVSAWEYQRDDQAAIQQLSLDFGKTTFGDTVRLYSRPAAQSDWRQRYLGVWFNAKVGDVWQHSKAIEIDANADPYWRLELSNGLQDTVTPKITLHHPQQILQFIANNNGPYRIGKTAEVPQQNASNSVFSQLLGESDVEWAALGLKPLENIRLPKAQQTQQNWMDLVFWLSLAIAVIVLLFFAIKLLRQLPQENAEK